MVEPQLSQKAVEGFAQAALYDQHRPSYPDEAVTALLEAAKLIGLDAASLVDLAAGTGKFTEALAARPERFRTLAVEPHAQMREQLARKNLDDVTVAEGYSTAIPAASETIDAVFVAQAFHWFANRESLHEIHRVLKPLGVLGLIWNAEDCTSWPHFFFSLPNRPFNHHHMFIAAAHTINSISSTLFHLFPSLSF
ncbi:unnamed protein product [Periconia digitata]|uniref:Methyltransferase type 11 domain-containing protein n=1 Tax=Periconia digitata TaxID=1303443 RepID=A0A9W4XZ63_9PLEO|nr:unnamed protein product [Periconia digitata]